jgi:N-glycosylase/DNA lyase
MTSAAREATDWLGIERESHGLISIHNQSHTHPLLLLTFFSPYPFELPAPRDARVRIRPGQARVLVLPGLGGGVAAPDRGAVLLRPTNYG